VACLRLHNILKLKSPSYFSHLWSGQFLGAVQRGQFLGGFVVSPFSFFLPVEVKVGSFFGGGGNFSPSASEVFGFGPGQGGWGSPTSWIDMEDFSTSSTIVLTILLAIKFKESSENVCGAVLLSWSAILLFMPSILMCLRYCKSSCDLR